MAKKLALEEPRHIETGVEEHMASLKTIRGAKRLFALLVWIAVLTQALFYAGGRFAGLLDAPGSPKRAAASAPAAATAPASQPVDLLDRARAYRSQIRTAASVAFPVCRLVGTAAAMLLATAMFLAILVSLAGRLGGARSMIIGFFHTLVLILLLCPWDQWLELEGVPMHGALYQFADVDAALARPLTTQVDRVSEYLQFLGLPAVALVVLIAVLIRFHRGFMFALERVDPELRVRLI